MRAGSLQKWPWATRLRELVRGVLPELLLSIALLPFVFVAPVNRWMGRRAFFCFVLAHIGFFPAGNTVGAHWQSVLVGLVSTLALTAIDYLVICCQVWIEHPNRIYSSPRSRGLGACAIFVLFFCTGYIWSRWPRLRTGMRVAMFVQTWALTGSLSEINVANFTNLYYPVLVTGVLSMLTLLVWPRSARGTFEGHLSRALGLAGTAIQQAAEDFEHELDVWRSREQSARGSQGRLGEPPALQKSGRILELRNAIDSALAEIHVALDAANFEVSWSRVPMSEQRALLPMLSSLRSWLGCGFGMQMPPSALETMLQERRGPDGRAQGPPTSDPSMDTLGARSVGADRGEASEEGNPSNEKAAESPGDEHDAGGTPGEKGATERAEQRGGCVREGTVGKDSVTEDGAPESANEPASPAAWELGPHDPALRQLHAELVQSITMLRAVHDTGCNAHISYDLDPISQKLLGTLHESRRNRQRDAQPCTALVAERRAALLAAVDEAWRSLHALVMARGHLEGCAAPEGTPRGTATGTPEPGVRFARLSGPSLFRTEMYAACAYSVSLIEVASSVEQALKSTEEIVAHLFAPRRKLYVPRFDWSRWFTSSGGMGMFQAGVGATSRTGVDMGDVEDPNTPGADAEQVTPEHASQIHRSIFDEAPRTDWYKTYAMGVARASHHQHQHRESPGIRPPFLKRVRGYASRTIHRFSRDRRMITVRIAVSQTLRGLRHSRHTRFSFKLAAGVLLLCVPALLTPEGRAWWNSQHGQWMVITYIWCLEASTGDSLRISLFRTLGTIMGALLGFVAFEVSRGEKYALATLVVVFDLFATLLRLYTPYPPIGAVMGLTTPIVALVPYLGMSQYSAPLVALVRGYMILLGISAALAMNLILWPYHARVKLMHALANTSIELQALYLSLARQMLYAGFLSTRQSHETFTVLEKSIAARLTRCRALLGMMRGEISLVPKPMHLLEQLVRRLENVADVLIGLRMCREHGLRTLRKKVVTDISDLRGELVSALLLELWIFGQSMLSRSRLPQLLPSSRRALNELTAALALRYGEVFPHYDSPASGSVAWMDSDATLRCIAPLRDRQTASTTELPAVGDAVPAPASGLEAEADSIVYLLSEHAHLAQLTISTDALLQLTRVLLGEMRFVGLPSLVSVD